KLKLLINIINEITRKYGELLKTYEYLTQKLEFEAYHDPLTRLFNRNSLNSLLRMEVSRSKVLGNYKVEVLFIDLDNFKRINDTFGHSKGDKVLKKVSEIIRESIRNEDIPVRYGGDEFVVILKTKDRNIGYIVGERIRRGIEETFSQYGLSASYGVAIFPDDSENAEELINIADRRMYKMKREKKTRFPVVS
ncbi:MAG TPA: GGDEF domain-containing protein, partial [Aquifex aeolicus]|nr:GGDEF domain-containing protein [Aquifex aeolicus]